MELVSTRVNQSSISQRTELFSIKKTGIVLLNSICCFASIMLRYVLDGIAQLDT